MPKWSDFGGVLTTIRELDVSSIRAEAETPLSIVCVGHQEAVRAVEELLHRGHLRYPLATPSPLQSFPIEQAGQQIATIRSANLFILALDAQRPLPPQDAIALSRLNTIAIPYIVAYLYGNAPANSIDLPPAMNAHQVSIPDPAMLDAPDQLATTVLEHLAQEFHLSAVRRLPGLRAVFCRNLIAQSSFSNAAYALASGLPEQIPILNVPFAAADILVLTKNQAMLVYRLALAYGAPPDFQARIVEVIPVIGGAFLWRQAARSLIGLIPIWGLIPKIAIAYAGTYTTGISAWRWFEQGELVSSAQLKQITQEALAIGQERAKELVAQARETGGKLSQQARTATDQFSQQARTLGSEASQRVRETGSFLAQVRERLPFRKKQ